MATDLMAWLQTKLRPLPVSLSDMLAPCFLLPITIEDHLTIARTIQTSSEMIQLFPSLQTCSLSFRTCTQPLPTDPVHHLYATILTSSIDPHLLQLNHVPCPGLLYDTILVNPPQLRIGTKGYTSVNLPLPSSRLPVTLSVTLTPNHKNKPSVELMIKLHYLPRNIVIDPGVSPVAYDQYYREILVHLIKPDTAPSDSIEWLLDEYGRRYGISIKTRAQLHLEFLVKHNETSRDYFEMIIFWITRIDRGYLPDLVDTLRVKIEGYLRHYEVAGPWEKGALNALLRVVPWITDNPTQFIIQAIRDGLLFNYTRYQMNEEQDMIPSDASDCAALAQAARKIGIAMLNATNIYRDEFAAHFDLPLITGTYYYDLLSHDLIQKVDPNLIISNELFDLYAEMESLHRILFECGLTKMEVLPLHDLFQPCLVKYILQIEPTLRDLIHKYIAVEKPDAPSSAFDLFVTVARASQLFQRFKLSRHRFIAETILFIEMVGRVIQNYITQLWSSPSLIQISANLLEVKRQFKLLTQSVIRDDPRIVDLGSDIKIGIERHWPLLLDRITASIPVNPNPLAGLIPTLDEHISGWSDRLPPRHLMDLLLRIATQVAQVLENLVAPITDLKSNVLERPALAATCAGLLPDLIQFFNGEGEGLPLDELGTVFHRLRTICTLHETEPTMLIQCLDAPHELSEVQIISILMAKGKKIKLPGSGKVRSWRQLVGSKRCRRHHL